MPPSVHTLIILYPLFLIPYPFYGSGYKGSCRDRDINSVGAYGGFKRFTSKSGHTFKLIGHKRACVLIDDNLLIGLTFHCQNPLFKSYFRRRYFARDIQILKNATGYDMLYCHFI